MPERRFIAGARCPECGAQDTVYVLIHPTELQQGCTRCNFSDSLRRGDTGPDTITVVEVFDPGPGKT